MLLRRTLWSALAFCVPNLLWFAYLRQAALASAGQAAPRLWSHWLDLALPLATAIGLLISFKFYRAPADPRLAASERRFRSLIALAAESYWVIDDQLRIVSIDANPQNRLSAVAPAMLGRHIWEVAASPRSDPPALMAVFAGREQIDKLDLQAIDQHGQAIMLAFSAEPDFDESGAFRGFCGVAKDVTRRRQFEASSGLYEAALREASEPVLITDGDLDLPGPRITFVNPAFCTMTGYTSAELLGATPRMLQGPGTDRGALDQLRQTLARGEALRMEALNYRKSGEPFYVAWQISPVRDAAGKVVAFVAILHDVTERRRAELALLDMNVRLEERVHERTRELELAARELEAFSYSVSHDLRAPLRIVEGFADILSEDYGGRLDTLGNDHLKRIRSAAARMNQMITSLLAMARTTGAPLSRESVGLSKIAEELLAELGQEAPGRRVTMVIAREVAVEGDRVLLRVVMQNLLANAWKFSSRATEAKIEFGVARETGRSVYFVRDNGAGFDMKYSDRLFGVFQRLHSQSEFAGTGIGLATVQRIISRHGGKIWAESAAAGGATFYFTLWDGRGAAVGAGDR